MSVAEMKKGSRVAATVTQAAKVAPQDRDVRKKLSDCEREVKRLKFEEALAVPVSP